MCVCEEDSTVGHGSSTRNHEKWPWNFPWLLLYFIYCLYFLTSNQCLLLSGLLLSNASHILNACIIFFSYAFNKDLTHLNAFHFAWSTCGSYWEGEALCKGIRSGSSTPGGVCESGACTNMKPSLISQLLWAFCSTE